MGCSSSKETAIIELKQIIAQISNDNTELEKERDKLMSQKNIEPEKKCTLEDIRTMHFELEKELKTLDSMTSQLHEFSKSSNSVLDNRVKEILELKNKLDNRVIKIKQIMKDKDVLTTQFDELEAKITENEREIRNLEESNFTVEELNNTDFSLSKNSSELGSKKEKLFTEIQEIEKSLTELNKEIKDSHLDSQSKELDSSNNEGLLNLSDVEVNNELKKVDKELEELTEQINILKIKEQEFQHIENFIITNQTRPVFQKNENLKSQIKSSQERVELLEQEKLKVKDEISKLKRHSLIDDGLNDKLNALNNIIEKKKNRDEGNTKVISDNLVFDIEVTLKKAKQLALNVNEFD